MTAIYLLALALPAVAAGLLSPGASPFSVGPDALELSMETDCRVRSPVRRRKTSRSRSRCAGTGGCRSGLLGGPDGLLIAWTPDHIVYADAIEMPDGVTRHVVPPADALIEQAADVDDQGETFAIDVERVGLDDGAVRLTAIRN